MTILTPSLLLTFVLFTSVFATAMPEKNEKGFCTSLLSKNELEKGESLFRPQINKLVKSMNNPKVKLIWGHDKDGEITKPGFDNESITNPAIPQIPIPSQKKEKVLVFTRSEEMAESDRILTWTEFTLVTGPSSQETFYFLIGAAEPRYSNIQQLNLRVRHFVLNTLVALSAAPYVSFVAFKQPLYADTANKNEARLFTQILDRKMRGLPDWDTLRDLFPDQYALIELSSPHLSLKLLEIQGYRRSGGKTDKEPNLIKADFIEIAYLFHIPSLRLLFEPAGIIH